MTESGDTSLVVACEAALAEHGDTYLGVGWTQSQANADKRYRVMLDVIRPAEPGPVSLLDLGCGASHLLEFVLRHGPDDIEYTGLDLSAKFVALSRSKFPDIHYFHGDIDDPSLDIPTYDYVVMNGLFTWKGAMSFDGMVEHWKALTTSAMNHARIGVVFNVTSQYVDWERTDLFHAPVDLLTDFVAASPFPYFVVRNDYGLFETSVYAYRTASEA